MANTDYAAKARHSIGLDFIAQHLSCMDIRARMCGNRQMFLRIAPPLIQCIMRTPHKHTNESNEQTNTQTQSNHGEVGNGRQDVDAQACKAVKLVVHANKAAQPE
jgi:hypothetical protein